MHRDEVNSEEQHSGDFSPLLRVKANMQLVYILSDEVREHLNDMPTLYIANAIG